VRQHGKRPAAGSRSSGADRTLMHADARNGSGLTARQEKAIAALLSEATIAKAAEKIGVNESTLRRWLDDAAFETAYRQARREAVGQAIARLQQLSSSAVLVLAQLMADRTAPASVRLHAAKAILEFAIKAVELEDIEVRLAALEEAQRALPRR
jgi:transposase-like protein